jgi:hypothetical protein
MKAAFVCIFMTVVCLCTQVHGQENDSTFYLNIGKAKAKFIYQVIDQRQAIIIDTLRYVSPHDDIDSITRHDERLYMLPPNTYTYVRFNINTLENFVELRYDSVVHQRTLALLDTDVRGAMVKKGMRLDTVYMINPVTLEEVDTIEQFPIPQYTSRTEMNYVEFLAFIKNKIEFKNDSISYTASKAGIYFESADKYDFIYPIVSKDIAVKTASLVKGGYVMLYIEMAGNNDIEVQANGKYIARIDIWK